MSDVLSARDRKSQWVILLSLFAAILLVPGCSSVQRPHTQATGSDIAPEPAAAHAESDLSQAPKPDISVPPPDLSRTATLGLDPLPTAEPPGRKGVASYYGAGFAGQLTANGEHFDPSAMTAAHRTLAFGTRVRVTNLATGKDVIVRINDRGPYAKGRLIDLSRHAAEQIGMIRSGVAQVRVQVLN